ncbi:DNA methylase N-4/N-6 [uncultured Caudovirales phage]|uniref:DNA methylase N-4/N-6 n=1 Tax=uncultured Caudovirales phage TaxID=2100421 RepID=A0A6J5KWQ8_9CAUD|nr:DNA methylase N-4/N-6 [uncultured Caudovirales phage]
MRADYAEFLAGKAPRVEASGMKPFPMHGAMFDYQVQATGFCLEQGRAGLFLDTGLGKTICELEYAIQAGEATNGRALVMWSNPGDVVLSPFMGIGSEGYQAVKHGRRFLGVELKESYWRQATKFLTEASATADDLFALAAE